MIEMCYTLIAMTTMRGQGWSPYKASLTESSLINTGDTTCLLGIKLEILILFMNHESFLRALQDVANAVFR